VRKKYCNINKAKARLTALIVSVLILSALAGVQFIGKVSADYPFDWPMFGHDPQRMGYSESPAPNTNQTLWTASLGTFTGQTPAVADGKVYVGDWGGMVYCFDHETGEQIWNYTTGASIYCNPAVADGRVYTGSNDNNLYCLDALTGAKIWNYTTGNWVAGGSPTVVGGKVYVGSDDYNAYCFDAVTGALVWNYTTGGRVVGISAVDGRVYAGSVDDYNYYCLDALTGVSSYCS